MPGGIFIRGYLTSFAQAVGLDGQRLWGDYRAESRVPVAELEPVPQIETTTSGNSRWKIVGIATLPWFRWDEAMLEHGKRSDNYYNLPPGPRNPVGVVWIGLNKRGVGIHGTNSPNTIGRSGSHGCIRLANWDAARVINEVTSGMTVQIF